jgi:hypothetical protein
MALQHLRSSTADKRPTPAAMSDGQLALNTNLVSPGLFFKDSNGDSVKIGPVHVGTTAPNVTPGAGGQAGNSKGEAWLDTTAANPILKVWNGSAFVAVQPVGTGTVVSTTDTGTVTSTMILDGTILNADINASAAIADTKLATISTAGKVSGTAITSGAIATSGDLQITSTSPFFKLVESDGTSTHSQTSLTRNGDQFSIQTRDSTATLVSFDYLIPADASGATDHIWRIANTEKMRIDPSGRLLMGGITPATGTDNSICTPGRLQSDGTYSITTASAANVFINSSGLFLRSTSSIKYKTEVEDAELSYSEDLVYGSRPVWYRSLAESDPSDYSYWGFIAEEVAEIDPRMVHWGDDGPEGVQYDRYVVHLVSVIQKQQQRLDALESRIAALELN